MGLRHLLIHRLQAKGDIARGCDSHGRVNIDASVDTVSFGDLLIKFCVARADLQAPKVLVCSAVRKPSVRRLARSMLTF